MISGPQTSAYSALETGQLSDSEPPDRLIGDIGVIECHPVIIGE
jgi:hypothetical protein